MLLETMAMPVDLKECDKNNNDDAEKSEENQFSPAIETIADELAEAISASVLQQVRANYVAEVGKRLTDITLTVGNDQEKKGSSEEDSIEYSDEDFVILEDLVVGSDENDSEVEACDHEVCR